MRNNGVEVITACAAQPTPEEILLGEMADWLLEQTLRYGWPAIEQSETYRTVLGEISRVAEGCAFPAEPNLAPARRLISQHATDGSDFNVIVTVGGRVPFEVTPGVFNPALTKATVFLLKVLAALNDFEGKRFLDAFAGSGVVGACAAHAGAALVVTYDTSDQAVLCAKRNVDRNGLNNKMKVYHGDITSLPPDEKFDVVAANPPLLPGKPTEGEPLTSALFDPDLQSTTEFIRALPDRLTPGGRCYLLTSNAFDRNGQSVRSVCAQEGLAAQLIAATLRDYEWFRVHEIRANP
jgi:SAM-dependent methyltransferase